MAAPDLSANLQEEATCAICLDYFTDPVMTDCGHNFCRECIRRCWGQPEGPYACPECRELSAQRNLRPNRPLAKMAELARRLHPPSPVPPGVCAAHREPLAAFCGDELRLLCAGCERSGEHWAHRVRPLQDAADDLKGKLEVSLEQLRKQMEEALLFQAQAEETCALWQAGAGLGWGGDSQGCPVLGVDPDPGCGGRAQPGLSSPCPCPCRRWWTASGRTC